MGLAADPRDGDGFQSLAGPVRFEVLEHTEPASECARDGVAHAVDHGQQRFVGSLDHAVAAGVVAGEDAQGLGQPVTGRRGPIG